MANQVVNGEDNDENELLGSIPCFREDLRRMDLVSQVNTMSFVPSPITVLENTGLITSLVTIL